MFEKEHLQEYFAEGAKFHGHLRNPNDLFFMILDKYATISESLSVLSKVL